MGHYASEMGVYEPLSERQIAAKEAVRSRHEELSAFFGASAGMDYPCPICGVELKWNWMDATNALRHIDWHARMGQTVERA